MESNQTLIPTTSEQEDLSSNNNQNNINTMVMNNNNSDNNNITNHDHDDEEIKLNSNSENNNLENVHDVICSVVVVDELVVVVGGGNIDKILCNNSTSTVQSESVDCCDNVKKDAGESTVIDDCSLITEEKVNSEVNASSDRHDQEASTNQENQENQNVEKTVLIVEPEEDVKQAELQENSNENLNAESIIKVRERRISRRIVVNTNFSALTSETTSSETPVHNIDIFDESEVENDTSTYSSDIDDDGIISNVKDGYFEDSSSDLKGSDILFVKSSDTDGILVNNNGSVLKVNEAVNYYPSVNEINNGNKTEPKLYSSIIFESKHDTKRIQIFESIVSNYKEYVTKNPNQFRKLIREGIPTKDLLKTLWKRMVGSEELSNKYPGLYKKLTMHDDILEDDVHKILKDVHRTYPQYEFFSEKDGPGQMCLIRILKAYCHFDKQTGYCQGMAFICGFALMNLEDEEDTFWFFVQIMNNGKHGLKDIFAEGLPRLRLVMFMVSELIKLRLPDIHKHLEENYILPEMYASSILMTLCTNRFSFASSQRIWSIFLNEGWKM